MPNPGSDSPEGEPSINLERFFPREPLDPLAQLLSEIDQQAEAQQYAAWPDFELPEFQELGRGMVGILKKLRRHVTPDDYLAAADELRDRYRDPESKVAEDSVCRRLADDDLQFWHRVRALGGRFSPEFRGGLDIRITERGQDPDSGVPPWHHLRFFHGFRGFFRYHPITVKTW